MATRDARLKPGSPCPLAGTQKGGKTMRTRMVRTALLAIGVVMLMVPFVVFAQPPVERPLRGQTFDAAVIWGVPNQLENACSGGIIAGAASVANGVFSQLGDISSYVNAAWDWSQTPVPNHTPEGPTTASNAVVLPVGGNSYPHTFKFDPFATSFTCAPTATATGQVIIIAANGDFVFGQVTGGEVYELGFDNDGDGQ